MKKTQKKMMRFIIFGIIIIILSQVVGFKRSTLTLINTVIVFSICAVGFNILLGYGGQISLGHAAFVGLGAYVSAYMSTVLGLPFLLSLLIGGLIPMIVGILLGLIALRLEGHYLAIATLGFGVTIQQIFKEWVGFTNGYSGMRAKTPEIFGFAFKSRESFMILAIVILVLLCIVAYNLLRFKTGRAFIAMRDSEHAAQAMGISMLKYKLIAFSISAFYAGIAGGLYMHLIKFTQPDQWGIVFSLNLLAMVVIGGLGSIWGSILGATFITLMPEILKELPVIGEIRNVSTIVTGLVMILIIRFLPYGLAYLPKQLKLKRINKRNANETAEVKA